MLRENEWLLHAIVSIGNQWNATKYRQVYYNTLYILSPYMITKILNVVQWQRPMYNDERPTALVYTIKRHSNVLSCIAVNSHNLKLFNLKYQPDESA